MEKAKSLLKSRQFWTIVVLFIINGFSSIQQYVPPVVLPAINGALGILAIYFRIVPKQNF